MELTQEQKDIVNTVHDEDKVIQVQAYAGCSKTTTLIEVAKEIRKVDKKAKILYTVFNRSLMKEAESKFKKLRLNVECRTVHSLGLKYFKEKVKNNITIQNNFSPADIEREIVKGYNSRTTRTTVDLYNVLDMLNEYLTLSYDRAEFRRYMMSQSENLSPFKRDKVQDIITISYNVLDYMKSKDTYTHSMYLKEIACNNTDTLDGYDYIFVDECQDTNIMLYNILQRMTYKKLYVVGDTYQTIYTFLNTINLFDYINGTKYNLTTSFRITDYEVNLAHKLLEKCYGEQYTAHPITNINIDKFKDKSNVSVLFRTNSSMFMFAVSLLKEMKDIKVNFLSPANPDKEADFDKMYYDMLYFFAELLKSEGRLQDYNDMHCMFNIVKKYAPVDNLLPLAKAKNMSLYEYCKVCGTTSPELDRYFMVYNADHRDVIDTLQSFNINESKKTQSITFTLSTVHRYKGLESDYVIIGPDHWVLNTEEDINIMYVACTRSRYWLDSSAINGLVNEYVTKGCTHSRTVGNYDDFMVKVREIIKNLQGNLSSNEFNNQSTEEDWVLDCNYIDE